VRWRRPQLLVPVLVLVAAAIVAAGVVYGRKGPAGTPATARNTRMTVTALTPGGTAPDAATLDQARQIIETRVKAAGYAGVRVALDGQQKIVVTVAGTDADELPMLVSPARLRFRLVLDSLPAAATGPEPATPSPGPATTPSATTPSATTPSATTPSATPGTPESRLAAVIAKLGPAYQVAQQIQDPSQVDDQIVAQLAPFGLLSPDEVAVLPAAIQFKVPTVSCAQLDSRPLGAIDAVDQQVVACELSDTASTKYLLDRAALVGEDVDSAEAQSEPSGWVVNVHFKESGQERWTKLTAEASKDGAQRQVAIVLDNSVVTAPSIQMTIVNDAVIAADFTQARAQALASLLRSGVLPVTFSIVSIEQTSQ
jgi:preprotein translocase subunit SecD